MLVWMDIRHSGRAWATKRALSMKNMMFMAPDSENSASSGSGPCGSVYTTCASHTLRKD